MHRAPLITRHFVGYRLADVRAEVISIGSLLRPGRILSHMPARIGLYL